MIPLVIILIIVLVGLYFLFSIPWQFLCLLGLMAIMGYLRTRRLIDENAKGFTLPKGKDSKS